MTTQTTTSTRQDAVAIAQELAEEFRQRAAEYDRTGEFPKQNYDRMRKAGYLRAIVPEELGGLGATLPEMARAQQALARGCASTALAVNMHLFQVGAARDGYVKTGANEPALRRIAEQGIVLGSAGAEAIVAGAWTTPTTAVRQDGNYVVNGRKYFVSQAPGMDVLRVNAMDSETGEIIVLAVPASTPGVRVDETWDTTGMRATASHEVVLEDVTLPESAVAARLPGSEPLRTPQYAAILRWFWPLMSSVYLGVAEEARAIALGSLGKARNSALRDNVLTDAMIGEMELHFMTALSARDHLAPQLAEAPEPADVIRLGITLKEITVEHAIATVEKATAIMGGTSYFRKSPMERLARDARAGRFHPPSAPVAQQILGSRVR
ncbi:MAG TPA: acyl-CoA dehydrogenase family protein [Dehalococcoidia bacterium]|nr:acyl-CoA dehydrogenase family protein [Dehalococcoidia bacterium]